MRMFMSRHRRHIVLSIDGKRHLCLRLYIMPFRIIDIADSSLFMRVNHQISCPANAIGNKILRKCRAVELRERNVIHIGRCRENSRNV